MLISFGIILLILGTTTASAVVPNGATFNATVCFDDHISEMLKANNIPGASVAVLRRGDLAYEQGYGTRDAPGIGDDDEQRPVLPSTPFRIASISKTLTATTVLLLAQDGLLDLDAVVFGKGGPLHSMTNGHEGIDPQIFNITTRHLLRHSGGFPSLLDPDNPTSDPTFQSVRISAELGITGPASCVDTIIYMMDIPLSYSPGTKFEYNNFGYCVLGRVIEAVTGKTYEAAVREWLLDPAGVDPEEMYLGSMRLEDIPEKEAEYFSQVRPDCVGPSVYPEDCGAEVPCAYGSLAASEVADSLGAWVASARQLVKIIAVVSPPHCKEGDCLLGEFWRLELEARPEIYPSNSTVWMGLGWFIRADDEGGLIWQHDGGLPGTVATIMRMKEQNGYSYAMLFNGDNVTGLADESTELGDAMLVDSIAHCVGDDDWPVGAYSSSSYSATKLLEVRGVSVLLLAVFVTLLL